MKAGSKEETTMLSPIAKANEDATTMELYWRDIINQQAHKRIRLPTRPTLISIEGILGTRKTDIMNKLRNQYQDGTGDVVVLEEPINDSMDMKEYGSRMLMEYLADREKYSFAFQLYYFLTVERQIRRAMVSNPTKRVIVCERSLLSAKHVFMEMSNSNIDRVERAIYDLLFKEGGVRHAMPDEFIHLDSSIEKCSSQIVNSKNEDAITMFNREYLEECQSRHEAVGTTGGTKYHRIMADPEDIDTTVEKISGIIKEVRSKGIQKISSFEPERPRIISVEGNVGAGKSSLLRNLDKTLREQERNDILVIEEPVSAWTTITNGTDDIIQLFYNDPHKYALAFQTLIAVTTMITLHQAIAEHPEARVIVCERSLVSSRMIFAEALKDEGAMDDTEMLVYDELFKDEAISWILPDETIYLQVTPEICLERIRKRKRVGEQGLDLEWLRKYHSYHEKVISGRMGNSPFIINGDTEGSDRYDLVSQVIRWCDGTITRHTPQTSDHYWTEGKRLRKSPQKGTQLDAEAMVVTMGNNSTDEEKEMSIPIKVRYGTTTRCIGRSGDTLPVLTQRINESFEETCVEDWHLAWVPGEGMTPKVLEDDEELQLAMTTMQEQGKTVGWLIIIIREEHQL